MLGWNVALVNQLSPNPHWPLLETCKTPVRDAVLYNLIT